MHKIGNSEMNAYTLTQKPSAWLVTFESGDEELHLERPSVGETQVALYANTTPMTKENMVTVLEALKNSQEFVAANAEGKVRRGWVNHLDESDEAITIMQSAIEGMQWQTW